MAPYDAESIATIHEAIDLGITFYDTAEAYGPYEIEKLLGRALQHAKLTPEDLGGAAPAGASGDRYPSQAMAMLDR